MFSLSFQALLLGFALIAAAPDQEETVAWRLDKADIEVGAPISLTLTNVPRPVLRQTILRIADRNELRLQDYPMLRGPGASKRVFLLWFDWAKMDRVSSEPVKVRMLPLFDQVGTYHLTLQVNGRPIGSSQVLVVRPASSSAREAMSALYPEFVPGQAEANLWTVWMEAFMQPWKERVRQSVSDQVLQQVDERMLGAASHPDWAEILGAMVDHRRLQRGIGRLTRDVAASRPSGGTVQANAEITSLATKVIQANPKGQFAKVIRSYSLQEISQAQSDGHRPKIVFSGLPALVSSQPASGSE